MHRESLPYGYATLALQLQSDALDTAVPQGIAPAGALGALRKQFRGQAGHFCRGVNLWRG